MTRAARRQARLRTIVRALPLRRTLPIRSKKALNVRDKGKQCTRVRCK